MASAGALARAGLASRVRRLASWIGSVDQLGDRERDRRAGVDDRPARRLERIASPRRRERDDSLATVDRGKSGERVGRLACGAPFRGERIRYARVSTRFVPRILDESNGV